MKVIRAKTRRQSLDSLSRPQELPSDLQEFAEMKGFKENKVGIYEEDTGRM